MDKMSSVTKNELYHKYQPLFSTSTWDIHGYESLLRTQKQKNPQLFFEEAKRNNKLFELDALSIKNALSTFKFHRKNLLFINVFPSTLCNPNFKYFIETLLQKHSIPKNRVVFEINENSKFFSDDKLLELKQSITFLRDKGFLIALDNIRIQSLSLEQIMLFEPDYIKLDKFFSKNLATSKKKQRIIKKFVDYCHGESTLVLEGVNQAQDLAMAKLLGVSIAQGFLLGEPKELKEN